MPFVFAQKTTERRLKRLDFTNHMLTGESITVAFSLPTGVVSYGYTITDQRVWVLLGGSAGSYAVTVTATGGTSGVIKAYSFTLNIT